MSRTRGEFTYHRKTIAVKVDLLFFEELDRLCRKENITKQDYIMMLMTNDMINRKEKSCKK